MLILRRKAGESLLIGEDIKITVLTTDDGGVRLSIDAPKQIPVLRSELLNAMNANRDAALESQPQELLKMLEGTRTGLQKAKKDRE